MSDMLPVELETLDLNQQTDRAVKEAEARVEFLNRVMQVSLKRTLPQDWVDMQGKPYLSAAGAERLRPLFGITIDSQDVKRYSDKDERGDYYWFVVSGVAHFRGDDIAVMGTCSARDQFFSTRYEYENGQRKQTLLPAEAVDPTNILKSAYSNMIANAVTRILGIRGLTWDDLERIGFDRKKAASVKFADRKGTGQPSPAASHGPTTAPRAPAGSTPPDGTSWITSLETAIRTTLNAAAPQLATLADVHHLLQSLTAFERKDDQGNVTGSFPGFPDFAALRRSKNAERAAQIAYAKLAARVAEQTPSPAPPPAEPSDSDPVPEA